MIIGFHPRKEYLSTTSMGLIAVNSDGIILGVNTTGRMMLYGINIKDESNFKEVFSSAFGFIFRKLRNNDLVQITDWMGSTVFAIKYQNGFERNKIWDSEPVNENLNTYKACINCENLEMKKNNCILIQKTVDENNGNISLAASKLKISRTTIYKHLK